MRKQTFNWHHFASPAWFYRASGLWMPFILIAALLLFAYGLVAGLYFSPPDYQQGDGFRIIYVHVPAAFLSMMIYVGMALCAAVGLIWRIKLANILVRAAAPTGAWLTFLALVTGSIWGKPMWGTWWIWDARLTSELILLFLYLGYLGLYNAIVDRQKAYRASNVLLLVGVINIPIIHYSVQWWNTLHQSATLSKFAKPSIDASMLYPLLAMIFAFMLYALWVTLIRSRAELLKTEKNSRWVRELRA